MRVLVTGANGQLGYELARQAAELDFTVLAATRDEMDITDQVSVDENVTAFVPDVIINAAAYTAVDKAESERDLAFAINATGPANLARCAADRDIPLIHVSTDYVYDGAKDTAYVENDPTGPIGVYGASKLAGEAEVQRLCAKHVIVRTAWVYGVHGANFVKTMLKAGAGRPELSVVSDQHGSPTYAADLAGAILQIAERLMDPPANPAHYGVFHCAGSGSASWHGFAEAIFTLTADHLDQVPGVKPITTAEYPTPARRPANSRLDCSKLFSIYQIQIRHWEDALAEMLAKLYAGAQERTEA